MASLSGSPNVFHPTKPSAVGSRNSLAQQGRDLRSEYGQLITEEADNVLKELQTKLPADVLQRLDVMGGLQEKLYNYFNQNYQNMFNRFLTTTEDEMVKKVRDFVDKEESKVLAKYTPKEISQMLDQIAGGDKFNTGEIEKSMVNMYGHLQGHIQRGVNDLENETNSLLRQKTDVGGFVRGENAYSIVKCAFTDSKLKPKTVCDVKLSVNILDSELISPIFQYQATVEHIIKDQISRSIMSMIDHEVEQFQDSLIDEGKEELTDTQVMFEKMKRVTNFTDDEKEDETSKRYMIFAKNLMDKIEGLRAEIDPKEFDALNIRENIKKIVDLENIRNRGFNTAVNSITAILDTSKMGYQYVENFKNARELILREYDDVALQELPDERYKLRLKYYDAEQLLKERQAYNRQMEAFRLEIQRVWDVVDAIIESGKSNFHATDFDDLARKASKKVAQHRDTSPFEESGEPLVKEMNQLWNEISSLKIEPTEVERLNQTYTYEKDLFDKMLARTEERLKEFFGYQNTRERVILDKRIRFLQKEFYGFSYHINPYHVQPGLLLDVDISSIKRKRFMLLGMANVLNEFLHGVSKGFQDAAFAAFKRRRSTVRSDIEMEFDTSVEEEEGGISGSNSNDANSVVGQADVTPAAGQITSDDLQEM
jgi:hypothetical protein